VPVSAPLRRHRHIRQRPRLPISRPRHLDVDAIAENRPIHPGASYAYEKLLVALDSLAAGTGDVRERLLHAYECFPMLKPADFPEHLRADFQWVMDQLTRFGPRYHENGKLAQGSVEHTMRRIQNRRGARIARKIVHLYHELDGYLHDR